jgi:hypothetical protein
VRTKPTGQRVRASPSGRRGAGPVAGPSRHAAGDRAGDRRRRRLPFSKRQLPRSSSPWPWWRRCAGWRSWLGHEDGPAGGGRVRGGLVAYGLSRFFAACTWAGPVRHHYPWHPGSPRGGTATPWRRWCSAFYRAAGGAWPGDAYDTRGGQILARAAVAPEEWHDQSGFITVPEAPARPGAPTWAMPRPGGGPPWPGEAAASTHRSRPATIGTQGILDARRLRNRVSARRDPRRGPCRSRCPAGQTPLDRLKEAARATAARRDEPAPAARTWRSSPR